jgi:hypothetical protein
MLLRTLLSVIMPAASEGGKMQGKFGMRQNLRLILGFLGATALPGLYIAMPFLTGGQWQSGLMIAALGLGIAAPLALLVVLPLYLWLRRTGRLRLYWAMMTGGAAGTALGLIGVIDWIWRFGAGKTVLEIWQGAIAYSDPHVLFLAGAVCGLFGWLIAFGPRLAPRKDAAS